VPAQRTDERPLGVVYTPASVASAMVRIALEPLVRGRSAGELAALRICDFAVGEGAFVRCVIDQLAAAIRGAWTHENTRDDEALSRTLAAACVTGVDVDARAIAIAREATACENLRVGDALSLDWNDPGFDVVVGNPPYVRQEWLADKRALDRYEVADGVADLYVYFLELAHRILRPGGRYCVITPNKWLTAEYARPLRAFLTARGSVEGVVDLARLPLFADADAFPCIVWGSTGIRRQPRGHRAISGDVEAALRDPGVPLTPSAEPWHIDDDASRALIERLERWPALGTLLPDRPARGVVTGCNRAFVIDRATRDRLIAEHASSAALIRPFVKGRDLRRWRTAEIDRYLLLIDRGTPIDRYPALAGHLALFRAALEPKPVGHAGVWHGRKPGSYRWFELQDPVGALAASPQPRLVYQDIQTEPACALLDGGLVPDTTVWMLPTDDRYLLAVLNSSIYGFYARRRFPPALNGSVRPKLAYLRALPIATPTPAARRAIETLVDERLRGGSGELDRVIDDAVSDAYELERSERTLVRER
jgi:adenine-specific DNA-methyltransferase